MCNIPERQRVDRAVAAWKATRTHTAQRGDRPSEERKGTRRRGKAQLPAWKHQEPRKSHLSTLSPQNSRVRGRCTTAGRPPRRDALLGSAGCSARHRGIRHMKAPNATMRKQSFQLEWRWKRAQRTPAPSARPQVDIAS